MISPPLFFPAHLTHFSFWSYIIISYILVFKSPSSLLCFLSVHRELKGCWSQPLDLRSCPPRVLRGNHRQLISAQTTSRRWTLTPPRSSPVVPAIPPAPEAALRRVTPRLAQSEVKEQRCVSQSLHLMSPPLLPLQTRSPPPKWGATKVPALPPCTDWRKRQLSLVNTHCLKLECCNTVRYHWWELN